MTKDTIAARIAARVLAGQRRIADRVNRSLNRLPRSCLRTLCCLLGILFAASCLYLIIHAINH